MSTKIKQAAQEIQRIIEENGGITTREVIAAAKPKTSPLHDHFEWDDKKAGAEFRLHQARKLLRTVQIELHGKPAQLVHVTLTKQCEPGIYKPVSPEYLSKDEFQIALCDATTRLQSASESLDQLQNVAGRFRTTVSIAKQRVSSAVDAIGGIG